MSADATPRAGLNRIVLLGSAGSGKSLLGRQLAARLGTACIDTDDVLARAAGHPGAGTLLDAIGVDAFRRRERRLLERIDALDLHAGTIVLAPGGGSVTDAGWSPRQRDRVLLLDVDPTTAWQRIASSGYRPLAQSPGAVADRMGRQRSMHEAMAGTILDGRSDPLQLVDAALEACSTTPGVPVGGPAALELLTLSTAVAGTPVYVVRDAALAGEVDGLGAAVEDAGGMLLGQLDVPAGEWDKRWSGLQRIHRALAAAGMPRDGILLAAGGGSVTDLAGMAAATWRRGIRWIAVPTTLVGQVDAAIGGKVAINLDGVRNAIGSFHPPALVLSDPRMLRTLPAHEVANGIAELVRTCLLVGEDAIAALEGIDPAGPARVDLLEPLVAGAAQAKAATCVRDLREEQGERIHLNLGHTCAHALEEATASAVSHGAAVALGLRAALRASTSVHGLDTAFVGRVERLLTAWGLPESSDVAFEQLEPWLGHDKKATTGGLRWILLEAPGAPRVHGSEVTAAMARAWDSIVAGQTDQVRVPSGDVLVLLGVNLGDLADRPAGTYGGGSIGELERHVCSAAAARGLRAHVRVTDDLALCLDAIRMARNAGWPILLNPGAWTHGELVLADAIEPHPAPVVEVHLSEPNEREAVRHHSVVAEHCAARYAGHGRGSYDDALDWIVRWRDGAGAIGSPA